MIKIGTLIEMDRSIEGAIDQVRRIKDAGFNSAWATQIFGNDALTMLAVVGSHVEDIDLGTAVIPVYPRHPQIMAQQALTVQSATQNRLSLGIGLSHQIVVESLWGYSYDKPARYMREYLEALVPMLNGGTSMVTGEVITAITTGPLEIPDVEAPSLLVAALAPTMLKLAGTVADGTVTWMTGISTIETHIAPKIIQAANDAGRDAPRIEAAKDSIDEAFSIYPSLPSYKAMLDIEGVQRPADISLVGSAEQILDGIGRLTEAGGTELVCAFAGNKDEQHASFDLLASYARS